MKPNLWNVFLGELLTSKSHPEHDKGPQLDTAFCWGHKLKTACSYSKKSKRTAGHIAEWTLCYVYDTMVPLFESSSVIFLADFCSFSGANFKICSVHKWFDGGLSAKTTEPEVFLGNLALIESLCKQGLQNRHMKPHCEARLYSDVALLRNFLSPLYISNRMW